MAASNNTAECLRMLRLCQAGYYLQENERLRARLTEMQSHPSPLEAATAKRDEHLLDQEKFRKLIDSLQVNRHAPLARVRTQLIDKRCRPSIILGDSATKAADT